MCQVHMRALRVSKGLRKLSGPVADDDELTDSAQPEQGLNLIILNLSTDQMVHVEDCTTARSAWKKLRNLHAEPRTANGT